MQGSVMRMSLAAASLLILASCGSSNGDAERPDAVDAADGGEVRERDSSAADTPEPPDTGRDGGSSDAVSDADAETDSGGADAGDSGTDRGDAETSCPDSDSDGLTDCEEREQECLDPNDGDTDGDGLGDYEEVQKQLDPCSADTDGDGATDSEELKFELDPRRVSTFGDGIRDGDRWILSACDEENRNAETVKFFESRAGDWTLALSPAFKNYTELTLANTSNPEAAAVYDDPSAEVAGFLLSKEAPSSQNGPVDPLKASGAVRRALNSVASVEQDSTGGSFATHDGKRAATGEYEIEVSNAKSVRKIRDELLFELAPFGRSDAAGLPNSAGTKHGSYKVTVSVVFRTGSAGTTQSLISLAATPLSQFRSVDRIRFRMDDLTNTTNISERVDDHLVNCSTFLPGNDTPRAEFYWVLDQSVSMDEENGTVASFAEEFEKEVRNTALDYRLGVTNTDVRNDGHLRVPPGWHKSGTVFRSEIDGAVIDCSGWSCRSGTEHALEAARRGITFMSGLGSQTPSRAERIRGDADIVTVVMTDEVAHSIDDFRSKQEYINFFRGRSRVFAITGTGGGFLGCAEDAARLRDVALATGGKTASICASNLQKTIRQIIFAAVADEAFQLPQTPISSSLRVFVSDGNAGRTWVPRSRSDGFDYFAERNSIALFGSFRPNASGNPGGGGNRAGKYVAVKYETFKDRSKN